MSEADLDPRWEWIEVTMFGDPVATRGGNVSEDTAIPTFP